MNWHSTAKEWLTKNGYEGASDEKIKEMGETLKQQYNESVIRAHEGAKKPHESTKSESVEAAKDQGQLQIDQAAGMIPVQRQTADIHTGLRQARTNQDIQKHTAVTDNHTNSQMQILGGSYRDHLGDSLASKDRTVAGVLDYYNKRDARYADLVRSEHATAGRAQTMDMIGRLLGGAAMLAG